ncbi:MAG: hypothetical protein HC846_04605 [Blastocatellia bacterium]|nr:hypothetical protein [Blastocatellia bacterium]
MARLDFILTELPIWYDVDEPKDLERLHEDEHLQQFAPKTFEWLARLQKSTH